MGPLNGGPKSRMGAFAPLKKCSRHKKKAPFRRGLFCVYSLTIAYASLGFSLATRPTIFHLGDD